MKFKIIFLNSEFTIHTTSYYLDDRIFVAHWFESFSLWTHFSCGFVQSIAKPICIWILNHLYRRIHQFKSFATKREKKRTSLFVTKHNCIMSDFELNWVENVHKKCRYGSIKSISQYRLAVQLIWSSLQK